ncbi:MAG: hypothetical protein AB7V58_00480 [Solirubrobacterales bacterium]
MAILATALLLATAIPAAAADAATPFQAPGEMSLSFERETARLLGPEALVLVKCTGSPNGICSGTMTLSAAGHQHKAPFSVVVGAVQSLAVHVGSSRARGAGRALAVAKTAQPSGRFVRTTGVLRFR